MYGKQDLTELEDKVADLREDAAAQRKNLRRFINGMLACLVIIAVSAVANGFYAIPDGGNAGIIAACIIGFLCIGGGLLFYLSEGYDGDIPSKLRKQARDLERRKAAGVDQ